MTADGPVPDAPSAADWLSRYRYLTTARGHRIGYRSEGAGPAVVLLHGFPTWSYDWAQVAHALQADHQVITLDFLGYGASDKPRPYDYSVGEAADTVEAVLAALDITKIQLVVHDFGGIVGQELLDRLRRGVLPFELTGVDILNCGIAYSAYRPTTLQRILAKPIVGPALSRFVTPALLRKGLDGVRGEAKLTDAEWAELWTGIGRDDGHRLAHWLLRYNAERSAHHTRWESALAQWSGPLRLIWGLADPVSGRHVLEVVRRQLPGAQVTEIPAAGHFPQSEAPIPVTAALRG